MTGAREIVKARNIRATRGLDPETRERAAEVARSAFPSAREIFAHPDSSGGVYVEIWGEGGAQLFRVRDLDAV